MKREVKPGSFPDKQTISDAYNYILVKNQANIYKGVECDFRKCSEKVEFYFKVVVLS